MSHKAQLQFCHKVRERFPKYFKKVRVFDGGSLDINGNNKWLFEDFDYIGCDLKEGVNVNTVCKIHEYPGANESFDIVISTECFEHDPNYTDSIRNMVRMLKSGGLFIMSCATTGRPEHGTMRSDGNHANPFGDGEYYKNLTEEDIRNCFFFCLPLEAVFKEFEFTTNEEACDLYFWGIKK